MNAQAPLPPDAEFRQRLDALRRDARAGARFAFIGSAINFTASGRPSVVARLDAHAGFWNSVLGALQTSAIVALGRIYDTRRDVHSADHVLRHATFYPGIFSRTALAARKMAGLTRADAEAYARSAFEPTAQSFAPLRASLDAHTELYDATVGPIRDKVFAHAGRITTQEMHALFGNVPMANFERLAVFPLQLGEALWQLYENGIQPALQDAPTRIADVIADPVGHAAISWEHRHAVRDAMDFIDWLNEPPK